MICFKTNDVIRGDTQRIICFKTNGVIHDDAKIITIHTLFYFKNGGGSARCISAPDVCVDCLRVSFGWLMSLGRIARECIAEFGRGGACVPARVAQQGHFHR